jgi:4-oxalocrotonate tautomerase family enzyme
MIKVMMTKGRTKDQKVQLMKQLTTITALIADCPVEAVSVIIDDSYELDEWAVGGRTWEEIVDAGASIKIE